MKAIGLLGAVRATSTAGNMPVGSYIPAQWVVAVLWRCITIDDGGLAANES